MNASKTIGGLVRSKAHTGQVTAAILTLLAAACWAGGSEVTSDDSQRQVGHISRATGGRSEESVPVARELSPIRAQKAKAKGQSAASNTTPKATDPREKPDASAELPAAIAKAKTSVGVVSGKFSSGSGFLVAPGVLATNAHVVELEMIKDLRVRFLSADNPDAEALQVKLLYEDKKRDLALLGVKTDRPALALDAGQAAIEKRPIATIGTPADAIGGMAVDARGRTRVNAVHFGTLSELVIVGDNSYYKLDVPVGEGKVTSGNSGGPVLDRATGAVLGVVALEYSVRQRNGEKKGDICCVPVQSLARALATVAAPSDREKQAKAADGRHHLEMVYKHVCDPPDFDSLPERCVDAIRVLSLKGQGKQPRITIGGKQLTGDDYVEWFKGVHKARMDVARSALNAASSNQEVSRRSIKLADELVRDYGDLYKLVDTDRKFRIPNYEKQAIRLQKQVEQKQKELEKDLQLTTR
jgi:hypothetical protein